MKSDDESRSSNSVADVGANNELPDAFEESILSELAYSNTPEQQQLQSYNPYSSGETSGNSKESAERSDGCKLSQKDSNYNSQESAVSNAVEGQELVSEDDDMPALIEGADILANAEEIVKIEAVEDQEVVGEFLIEADVDANNELPDGFYQLSLGELDHHDYNIPTVEHYWIRTIDSKKFQLLNHIILEYSLLGQTLVHVASPHTLDVVCSMFKLGHRMSFASFSTAMPESERMREYQLFLNGKTKVLIVLSDDNGILNPDHIGNVKLVVNYDLPDSALVYLYKAGTRTSRLVFSFVTDTGGEELIQNIANYVQLEELPDLPDL